MCGAKRNVRFVPIAEGPGRIVAQEYSAYGALHGAFAGPVQGILEDMKLRFCVACGAKDDLQHHLSDHQRAEAVKRRAVKTKRGTLAALACRGGVSGRAPVVHCRTK